MNNSTRNGLLLGAMDVSSWQTRARTSPYAELWRYLVSRWEGVSAIWDEQGKPLDQGGLAWHSITPMVVEAAVIHRITGRDDARQYAIGCIEHILGSYSQMAQGQGYPGSDDLKKILRPANHRLGLKVLSHGEVALAADILGDALPEPLRQQIALFMKTTCIGFTRFEQLTGYASGGNILLCQNINAALAAITWGKASGYPNWEAVVDNTCDNVRQYLRNGCDEDGFSYEGAGYGLSVMEFIFLFCYVLRQAGWHDDLLVNEPRLRKIPDAHRHLVLPDGRCATMNDSGCAFMTKWWLLMLADEYDRPDYRGEWQSIAGPDHPQAPYGDRWPAQYRQANDDPRKIQHVDKSLLMTFLTWHAQAPVVSMADAEVPTGVFGEGTGTAAFRTSWGSQAIYSSILGAGRSRASHGHAHADCGHFNLAIGDEYLAVDAGRYNTNEDQHSIVLIDGKSRFPSTAPGKGMGHDSTSGRLLDFQRHPMVDYCVADARHMKQTIWANRHYLFVRTGGDDAYIVLLDNINVDNGTGPDGLLTHEYWWQLQCATTATIDITAQTTATVNGRSSRIDCAFFQKPEAPVAQCAHSLNVSQTIKEWVWPYGKDQDTTEMELLEETVSSVRRPMLLAVQHTLSNMMVSVLSPRRKGQANRVLRQIPVAQGIGLEVQGDGITDTLLIAPDHKLILTDTIKCFSEFALIRRNASGDIVDQWSQSGEPIIQR